VTIEVRSEEGKALRRDTLASPQSDTRTRPLVSIIVPCFNQARYLPDAVRSVRCQTYGQCETLIVDDGSTDQTRKVALGFEKVKYFYQENRGLASARNVGIRECRGDFLVFLDADDLLLPTALQIGVDELLSHPECAFVSGDHRRVNADLLPLFKFRARPIQREHYLAFLRGNYIGMHATVMYRRKPLEQAGGFDESLGACEDYDLYLRIAREHPVCCHGCVVADYRQHETNMSRDPEFMLKWALAVHGAQYKHVKGHPSLERAYHEGDRYFREYYGDQIFRHLRARFRISPVDFSSARGLSSVLLQYPSGNVLAARTKQKLEYLYGAMRKAVRRATVWPPLRKIRFGALRSEHPIGSERGDQQSITEWYSDHWLGQQHASLKGRVLRVDGAELSADRMDAVSSEAYDAVICPLQLQSVYDLESAVRRMWRVLKPSGVLFATLPAVTTARGPNENDFWRFTAISARRLFELQFSKDLIEVQPFGNVLTSIGTLHRVPAGEFSQRELHTVGAQHPVVIGVKATKR
jgi:glycosyltransferase involved in cell wall biosynthesis